MHNYIGLMGRIEAIRDYVWSLKLGKNRETREIYRIGYFISLPWQSGRSFIYTDAHVGRCVCNTAVFCFKTTFLREPE